MLDGIDVIAVDIDECDPELKMSQIDFSAKKVRNTVRQTPQK